MLKTENLYSMSDAMATAKMMNEFGLTFITTVENENEDLKRKPPFTSVDIAEWFEEAIRIIQKRYEEDFDDETFDGESDYVNGPIHIVADKDGNVSLSIRLFSNFVDNHTHTTEE